ncbi:hypothetical protein ACOME3_008473 [Neoechinorhynchus agilis]
MSRNKHKLNEKELFLFEKYKKFKEDDEEAIEWMGLTLEEACKKMEGMERDAIEKNVVPLRKVYEKELEESIVNAHNSGVEFSEIE